MTELLLKLKHIYRKIQATDFEKSPFIKVLILAALLIAMTFLAPTQNQLNLHYEVGTIWTHEDVIAPFSFPIYKDPVEYNKEVKAAISNVKPVFDRIEIERYRLDSATAFISQVQSALELQLEMARERNRKAYSRDSVNLYGILQNLSYKFPESDWHQLLVNTYRNPATIRRIGSLSAIVTPILSTDYQTGIIDRPRDQVGSSVIVVRQKNAETPVAIQQVMTLQDVSNQLDLGALSVLKGDTSTSQILSTALVSQVLPNLSYNRTQTQREINAAIDLVPKTIGFVKENERIIGQHDRITNDIKLKLDSLEKALRARTGAADILLQYGGNFLMMAVIIGLLSIYLFLFRKKIFHNNKMLLLIAVLLVFEGLLMYFAFTAQTTLPVQYLVLVPVASMILTIVFDSRVAFQATVAIALLVGATRGNDFSTAFTALSAGALAVYTVRDIKNRTQIFRSLVFIFLGYAVATLAVSFQRAEDASTILADFSLIAVNSVLSPIITFGLLIFFEKVFNIATDLTLLELSDFNQPLLRELSQKAPGTFHHSIIVGTLAEKAAEAVGANPILARVGAYYHDIGKTLRPEYFIENTMDSTKSKHDWLPPDISVQRVVSHVTEGIELGKKYHLPQRILDFIPMHHGTTLVAYFYGKALKRPFATGDVSEEDYRYEGPRPRSKETAIVMLADSVEAATRSLAEKSVGSIVSMIDTIVKSRYEEGQLDETNLTFGDLTKIKESFYAVLSGIYHKRIVYPGQASSPQDEKSEKVDDIPEPTGELSQQELEELAPPSPVKPKRKPSRPSPASTSKRARRR